MTPRIAKGAVTLVSRTNGGGVCVGVGEEVVLDEVTLDAVVEVDEEMRTVEVAEMIVGMGIEVVIVMEMVRVRDTTD